MGRKFGTDVLLPVALWLYFLSSIQTGSIPDRLWVNDHLDIEEEKLRFSN